jgi:hypothetical protein
MTSGEPAGCSVGRAFESGVPLRDLAVDEVGQDLDRLVELLVRLFL